MYAYIQTTAEYYLKLSFIIQIYRQGNWSKSTLKGITPWNQVMTFQSRFVWLHIIPIHKIMKYMSKYHNKYETKDVSCSAKPPIQNHNATNPKMAILNKLLQINNAQLSYQHLKKYSYFIDLRVTWKTSAVKFSYQSF